MMTNRSLFRRMFLMLSIAGLAFSRAWPLAEERSCRSLSITLSRAGFARFGQDDRCPAHEALSAKRSVHWLTCAAS